MRQSETFIIFTATYPPYIGGIAGHTYEIALELVGRGHRVVVMTSSIDGLPDLEQPQDGRLTVYRLPSWYLASDRLPVIKPCSTLFKFTKELRKIPHPKVIIQASYYPICLFGARLAKKEGWPCILIQHNSNYVCQGKNLVDTLEHGYEYVMTKLVGRCCVANCGVSGISSDWLDHFGIKADGVLYNSVDYRKIEEILAKPGKGFRQAFDIGERTLLVVFVGRMIPEKGIVQFVEAIDQLAEEGADIAAIIAGGGPIFDKVRCHERRGLYFLGETPREDILKLLKESDCYCLPSDSEGFPTSVLEAIVCKCYTVVAPYGGAKEIISDAAYGTVMKDNTKEDIIAALRPLLADRSHMSGCVEAAYQRFLSGFTWTATCERLENLKWE